MGRLNLIKILSVVLFGMSVFNASGAYGNMNRKIVQEGIRYKIVEHMTYPLALVCRYDDDAENKKMYRGKIELPDSIHYEGVSYVVEGLDDYAFDGCSDLDELILPETTIHLWPYSIANCGEVSVKFPDYLRCFDYGVFYNTRIREPFDLPDIGATSAYFFAAMPWVTEYLVKKNCYKIGTHTFIDSNVSKIEFEEHRKDAWITLDAAAFGCGEFEEVTLPNNSLIMYHRVFSEMPNLKRITISDSEYILVRYSDNVECGPQKTRWVADCPILEEIVCLAPTPPKVIHDPTKVIFDEAVIMDDNSGIVLKVPAGSEQLYAGDPVWKQFVNISDLDGNVYKSSLIDQQLSVCQATNRIVSDGNSPINISVSEPSTVSIFSVDGVEMVREYVEPGELKKPLPVGVYIVRIFPRP